jgi:hypothetical protein
VEERSICSDELMQRERLSACIEHRRAVQGLKMIPILNVRLDSTSGHHLHLAEMGSF